MELTFAKNKDRDFVRTLNNRVASYFTGNQLTRHSNVLGWAKAFLLLSAYLIGYASLFNQSSVTGLFLCYSLLGALKIFLALNVAHDAAHNTFSANKKVNKALLMVFDVLGANGSVWQFRHIAHHAYTNIADYDVDIKQSWLVRIFPASPWRNLHRFQHIYMLALYGIYTLNWLILRDLSDAWKYHTKQQKPLMKVMAIGMKAMYLLMMIFLPYSLLDFSLGQVLTGFLVMHVTASYTVASVLASTHVGLAAEFPEPNNEGMMPYSYERHQLMTTVDFATDNWFITQLYGGFNHHVIHHLFPSVCHVHYPQLTSILIHTCKEFDMPYKSNETMLDAILSHLKLLKLRGQQNIKVSLPEF